MADFDDDESWRDSVVPPEPPKKNERIQLVKPTDRGTLPEIKVVPEVHLTTEQMAAALRADDELFYRAGALTHVIRQEQTLPEIVAGTPVTREMPLSMLVNRVSRFARTLKWNAKLSKYVQVPPPKDCVRAVLEQGSWPGIRELRGIIEAPAMRPDGTIIQERGYDAATGFVFEPNADYPRVEDAPSHSECVLAYAKLLEPFKDFPYVNEAHRSAVIASVLTLLARPGIKGSVPCWLFDASASRSGKSLQVDAIALIVTGRSASRMTYPETDEELEKVLSSYAMRGANLINFDNVARPFGGAALDKCITAVDKVDLRVLGSTDLRTVDWTATIIASGNNVTCRGDMLARVLSPRLESPHDNPERRTDIAIADLRGWVLERRAELVHAGLTILRGFVAAGRPDQGCARWGGFEAWSRLIPQALKWVGAEDPMGARRGLENDADPERMLQRAFIDGWERLCTQHDAAIGGLAVKRALELLYPERSPHDPPVPPDGFDDLREAVETLADAKRGFAPPPRRIGDFIRKMKGKYVNGRKFDAAITVGGVARWRVVRADTAS